MQSINDTSDMSISPQPTKRRRSSILKPADRPPMYRDSRTVSFNITHFLADEDMEITTMEADETISRSTDMSIDNTMERVDRLEPVDPKEPVRPPPVKQVSPMQPPIRSAQKAQPLAQAAQPAQPTPAKQPTQPTQPTQPVQPSQPIEPEVSIKMVAGLNNYTFDESEIIDDETLFGAFHDSNNMSFVSVRTSGFDTLMLNVDALNERYLQVEHELEECRQRLDFEIEELFKFHRHVINKDDKYEFAIAILGLRNSLWLWFKINPETYPNEKLNVRIVTQKKDRNLYPLKDYAKIVSRYTKEGHHGYLTKFVINAQRFRRLLRKVGYGRAN